ncbi:MAG: hypothetical protein GX811_13340, partial [Lentisphaerae bacterium]|nr:hypothetical protein [Lentisphaerota bacterium]
MKKVLVSIVAVLLSALYLPAEEVQQTNVVSVVLTTQDGSRIVGSPVNAEIALETTFGSVSLPLAILKVIENETSTTNTVLHFENGDRLSGKWQDEAFMLKTAFGEQKVSLALVKSI